MNTQIIAIANQKGGVGKTTTCANLGIGLAQTGKKVLLIDGDPQGSLTISLGHPQPDKLPFTLSDAMGHILMDEALRPGEGILHHPEGVDLMPADIQLSGMEVSLVNAMSRETILRQYLDTLKGQYSHILIDCLEQLFQALGRQILRLNGNYDPVGGCQGIDREHTKGGLTVNKDMGILSLYRVQILPQDGLAAHGVHQRNLHTRELDVRRHQVNAFRVVQDTLAGSQWLVHQDAAHRVGQGKGQLVRLRVAQADGQDRKSTRLNSSHQ